MPHIDEEVYLLHVEEQVYLPHVGRRFICTM